MQFLKFKQYIQLPRKKKVNQAVTAETVYRLQTQFTDSGAKMTLLRRKIN